MDRRQKCARIRIDSHRERGIEMRICSAGIACGNGNATEHDVRTDFAALIIRLRSKLQRRASRLAGFFYAPKRHQHRSAIVERLELVLAVAKRTSALETECEVLQSLLVPSEP